MHTQLLARYDAERIAVGIPPVKPYPHFFKVQSNWNEGENAENAN
jgi:hypothetical protein